ncbi:A disintegrin and metalloproteinase with thrombospondin motifs 9-like [Ostrea edulis]|uniref:A disintegrin and metalloproteinase with thrombospondin motifs 9-like n=1 Tax=Ostrea edulis TaxID=37623 RepID=UPI0024AF4091|nr:A disintegrin and metalloproteinase with thrombospondin motifs 9-like [Ostrea edulis]
MTSSVHLMLRRKENNLSDRICLDISEVTLVMSVHMQFLVLLATLPSVVLSLTILKPGKSRSVLCSFCRTRYSYLKLFYSRPLIHVLCQCTTQSDGTPMKFPSNNPNSDHENCKILGYSDDNVYHYSNISKEEESYDITGKDGTGSEYVDIDWDVIQKEKDQLVNFSKKFKDDIATDPEVNSGTGNEDFIQAAEESMPVPSMNVHIMAVIDSQLFRKFLIRNQRDIRQTHNAIILYFSMVFAMVNERFQTMKKYGLGMKIRLAAIVIEEREQDAPWLRGHIQRNSYTMEPMIDAESALKDLTKWLKNNNLPDYDHAVAFTGYTLVKNAKKIDGLAYMNKICDRRGHSSSIVGENGDFMSVGVVAHEIAHSLGASHDDSSGNGGNCSADDNYIMAPQHQMDPDKVKNLYQFSSCSTNKIVQHIRSEAPQCLSDENHNFLYSYNLDKQPPGQMFTQETQCKLVFGDNSTVCYYATKSSSDPDAFCGNIWCQNPNNPKMCQTKARLVTLPGTICDDNKICRMGKCVPKQINRESEQCGAVEEDEVYCRTLLQRQGNQACQFTAVRNVCCRTCLRTGLDNQSVVRK